MRERLASIRQKLDRLRSVDIERRVFGARRVGDYGHEYREWPVLDERGVAAMEAEEQVTLPEELRAFLTTVHGGGPGPGYGFHAWGEAPRVSRPFPYTRADVALLNERRRTNRSASLELTDEDEKGCWPPGSGFLALADLGCGVTDALVVTGELRGTVWCCDMAWRPSETSFVEGLPCNVACGATASTRRSGRQLQRGCAIGNVARSQGPRASATLRKRASARSLLSPIGGGRMETNAR
jgi:hypothetical protein